MRATAIRAGQWCHKWVMVRATAKSGYACIVKDHPIFNSIINKDGLRTLYCTVDSILQYLSIYVSLLRIYFLLGKSVAPQSVKHIFTDRPTTPPPFSTPPHPNNKNCPMGKDDYNAFVPNIFGVVT